jgi:hypothetical protein
MSGGHLNPKPSIPRRIQKNATIRVWRCGVILLICAFLPVDAFVTRFKAEIDANSCSAVASMAGPASGANVDPASRFHIDMLRVLESRGNLASNSALSLSPMERRKRPTVLKSDIDGAERVAGMLQHMVDIGVATEESYQIVLQALSDRGRMRWRRKDSTVICAADEVGTLFDELWEKQGGEVSEETCNLVLKAYAICSTPRGNRRYAQKAQALLESMEESGMIVSGESLSHVVHAWAWQQENLESGKCAKMAQQNFVRLVELSKDNETVLQSSHWLLEAWSKSSSEGSSEMAEKILQKMIELKKSDPQSSFPNAQSFSNAILAWAKNNGERSAEKAHDMLLKTIESYGNGDLAAHSEPELIAFNGVISAWARIGRADKAEEVLWMADELGSTCKSLVPDVVSFNTVLHAYIKTKGRARALDQVLHILKHMEDSSAENPAIKPDSFTYSTVLKVRNVRPFTMKYQYRAHIVSGNLQAWYHSNHPDAPVQVEQVLRKMTDLWAKGDKAAEPSNHHYNLVINSLAKSRDHLDARKAYELLLQMQASDRCDPDIISYTSVIECFSKSKDPEAAEISMDLLQQVSDAYEETRDPQIMPNLRTYTMAIQALSTNPTLDNVQKARDLLSRLVELFEETKDAKLRPSAFPYNYVLNCAANCIGTTRDELTAFQIATRTYNDMRKSDVVKPDSFTYAFWFKCCNNLLPEGDLRTKGVTYSFEQCKLDGLVSSETLRRLLAGTPPKVVCKLVGIEPNTPPTIYKRMTIEDLPPGWSRNFRAR